MDNVSSLLDKRTLITGASRGIGAAIARKLAKAGADIAMTYKRSTDKAGGRTLRSKGSLFTGWTGRPMKPVAPPPRGFSFSFFFCSFFIGPFWAQRGSSAEFDRIAIVSAFDPELMAIEQAIIPKKVENKIEEVNGRRVRL